jgi:hypothetical protein
MVHSPNLVNTTVTPQKNKRNKKHPKKREKKYNPLPRREKEKRRKNERKMT